MSTDTYPEVSVDESGIVPPQGGRSSEWPKKLRTLTAAELDRLTIDDSGRFYWDGKLVDYDTGSNQQADKPSDSLDHSMDILDRASRDLSTRKSLTTIEGQLFEQPLANDDFGAVKLDAIRAQGAAAIADALAPPPPSVRTSDQTRLTLSTAQAACAIVVVVAIVIGAIGMATYGYVAVRDWGCKTSPSQSGCPVLNAPAPRADIPA